MMMTLFFLLTDIALVVAASYSHPTKAYPNKTSFSLFVFGDSYTASGFNAESPAPNISNPFGFPPLGKYPNEPLNNTFLGSVPGTSANGALWTEYLAAQFNSTVTLLYNFAVSGASIPDSFRDQIKTVYEPRYSSLYTDGTPVDVQWSSNSSIFASWIGINDINFCTPLFSPDLNVTLDECLSQRMEQYFELMSNLYDTGARNYFFINMPPIDRTPMVLNQTEPIIANYSYAVNYYNQNLLPAYATNFTMAHLGVRSIIYDSYSLFTRVLNDPHEYGFANSTCYSCICSFWNPICPWSNDFHPTTRIQELLAKDMITNLTTIGWPSTSKTTAVMPTQSKGLTGAAGASKTTLQSSVAQIFLAMCFMLM